VSGALAAVLAAVAAGLLAGHRPSLIAVRLAESHGGAPHRLVRLRHGRPTSASRDVRPRAGRRWIRPATKPFAGGADVLRRDADVVEACLALAAELQAGAPVARAMAAVAEDWPELFGSAAVRAATGGDVAAALREAATAPGAASLRAVAAGWEVTDCTGAPLSRVVVAVADSLRTEAAVRREASSQLATARATARILALLPFGTLLLLSGGDGAAIAFLVSSPIGLACLGGAIAFVGVGLWWVGRLTRSATRSAWEA
jgi:tight adherence protein B